MYSYLHAHATDVYVIYEHQICPRICLVRVHLPAAESFMPSLILCSACVQSEAEVEDLNSLANEAFCFAWGDRGAPGAEIATAFSGDPTVDPSMEYHKMASPRFPECPRTLRVRYGAPFRRSA